MDTPHLNRFCGGGYFWDTGLTWNTTNPDFTECFQKTALTWVPCGLLWLFCPVEIYTLYHSSSGRIPWTILNIAKTLICTILVLLSLGELSGSIVLYANQFAVPHVDFVTPSFKLATFVLVLVFTLVERNRGIQSSGVQWFFWLVYAISGAVVYRSFLLNAFNMDEVTDSSEFVMEAIFYPLLLMQFILGCLADAPPISLKDNYLYSEQKPCPELQASFPSWLFFTWFDGMVYKGYRKDLEIKDLWALNPTDTSKEVYSYFNKYWQPEIKKAMSDYQAYYSKSDGDHVRAIRSQVSTEEDKSGLKGPSIVKVLFQSFGWLYIFATVLKLISDLFLFANPMILDLLINFVGSDEPQWRGFVYAFTMLAVSIVNLVLMARSSHFCYLVAMRIRSALIATIYRKALRLSSSAKRNYTTGEVVNLMAVDVQRMMDVTVFFNYVWTAPIQFSVALYLLWQRLGVAVLAGVCVLVVLNVLTTCVIGYAKRLQAQQMKLKDHRIKLMNEILSGIKVLKLYAWEQCFMDLVNGIRSQEVIVLRKAAYFGIAMSFTWMSSSVLVTLMTFTTYVLLDPSNVLDANKAFVSLSLFNVMQTPIVLMPMVIMTMVQASVAIKRIGKFLMSDELDPDNIINDHNKTYPLILENASFSWSVDENPVLTNINLRVRNNALVAIVGPVGAGKSSLISAMLGEMEKTSGKVFSSGSLAYVAQQAWMQNATVRENILFGKPFKGEFYNRVIDSCALQPDLQILPGGDQTEIGEKGINLSGGQKQRVSLARSVYSDAEVYLFDDPLSAVDVHVGRHIFDNVMGPKGMLKDKTRILVTHRITFLPQVDLIVVVHEGTISEVGTYKELLDRKGVFAEFLVTYLNETEEDEEVANEIKSLKEDILDKIGSVESDSPLARSLSRIDTERQLSRQDTLNKSLTLSPGAVRRRQSRREDDVQNAKSGTLTVTEAVETGRVEWSTYIGYMRSITWKTIIVMTILYMTGYGCSMGSSLWLSSWSNDQPLPDGTQDLALRNKRLGVFGMLGILFTLLALFAGLVLTRGTTKAAEKMHASLLDNVLHGPMSFFDTTPLGRIVNRFSKDVDTMDLTIPQVMQQWLGSLCQVFTTIVVISIGTPIFLAAAVPIGIVYYFMQRFYVATSRQLKRLESITRSPIYSHFSESVTGAATIRAFGMQDHFIQQSDVKVDENQICYYPSIISNRWIGMRLEIIGNMLVFCAALFAVLGRETLNPGIVGLTVSYALSITFLLNWVVRMTSELETNIVAVERIKEYTTSPTEALWNIPETKPPIEWPSRGEITFDGYSVRYREGLDLVLRKATCNIRSGEKVGIVGRTGAGKSSLTLSVFRLIESAGGAILIDGIDIATLGLHDLRSKLTIIPQDPVLFSGSLRMNLDPFDQHSDEDVFKVLELAHLRAFIMGLSDCLLHEVSEGGENLSVGQRQLVCLARALLRKSKILVLDEATAAVDLETDDLIQATIRKEFADCTVVTIAHRLNTIMDYDRIMVLDQGIIKEFETPAILLQNKSSIFHAMAKDAGLT